MIDIFDKDKVASMIAQAKEISDCVIFVAHWGKEDEPMPTEYEKQWAVFLMKQGVDVVIGGHPHILQPYGRMSDNEGNEMVIFYSLGNFVSTQQSLANLLGGMAQFTIQKSVLKGETTVQILTPEVKPLVMHYDRDNGEYGPYMLEDYTEELASRHSVREIIGDEFTLSNLQTEFEQIMSMNVTPSTNTSLLEVSFDYEMNMYDANGNIVEDTWSISADQYRQELADGTASQDGSEESGSDAGDYDGSEDDGSYGDEDSGYYDTDYYDDSEYYDEY